MIYEKINNLFDCADGKKILNDSYKFIKDFSLGEKLKEGVLVGFSGGADSVMLLIVLNELRKKLGEYKILAVHINHMIRGEEADRDERFAEVFCSELGIEFVSFKADVPKIAKESSKSIEDAARNVRYSKFTEIISGRNNIKYIAVAHNSTDNLETVFINLIRGAGTRGMSGIMPVRDNILRPMLYSSNGEIRRALDHAQIPYIIDSTNLSDEYLRNYIRNNIIPAFTKVCSSVEESGLKVSENLRADDDFITSEAKKILEKNNYSLRVSDINLCHKSLFFRIIYLFVLNKTGVTLQKNHADKIYSLINSGSFSYDLPGGVTFYIQNGTVDVTESKKFKKDYILPTTKLHLGENIIEGYFGKIIVSKTPFSKSFLNVYKNAIQQTIHFDIISKDLFIRSKIDGDSYFYGGITHKLKKIFNDKSIPPRYRTRVPVFCDDEGIVWIPGFGIRKNSDSPKLFIAIVFDEFDLSSENRLYLGNEWMTSR